MPYRDPIYLTLIPLLRKDSQIACDGKKCPPVPPPATIILNLGFINKPLIICARTDFSSACNIQQNTHRDQCEDSVGPTIANKWHRNPSCWSKSHNISCINQKINHYRNNDTKGQKHAK